MRSVGIGRLRDHRRGFSTSLHFPCTKEKQRREFLFHYLCFARFWKVHYIYLPNARKMPRKMRITTTTTTIAKTTRCRVDKCMMAKYICYSRERRFDTDTARYIWPNSERLILSNLISSRFRRMIDNKYKAYTAQAGIARN